MNFHTEECERNGHEYMKKEHEPILPFIRGLLFSMHDLWKPIVK